MKRFPAILSAFFNVGHCITQAKLFEIEAFLLAIEQGRSAVDFEPEQVEPRGFAIDLDGERMALDQVPATSSSPRQFVAVHPLFGTMFQHGSLEMDASGGTSTDAWTQQFNKLDANPSVKTIVIEAHSPGGQVWGTEEAANAVHAAAKAGRTRIVSAVNSQAASAALWLSTAANRIDVTPGGEMGSIGVLCIHRDFSKAEEAEGVKTTLVATPERKVLGHSYAPLSDEGLEMMQKSNEGTYAKFVATVARNRGVSQAKVEKDFGGGGMLSADEAVKAGLADGIATMADVMDRELGSLKKAGRKSVKNRMAIAALE